MRKSFLNKMPSNIMNKKHLITLTFLILINLVLISAINDIRECRNDCQQEKRNEIRQCNTGYNECKSICINDKRECYLQAKNSSVSCRQECLDIDDRKNKSLCLRQCSGEYRESVKSCSQEYRQCSDSCKEEKNNATWEYKQTYDSCINQCTFNDEEQTKSEINYEVDELLCNNSGGFYQQLCKGPFFGIVCSKEKYCQCQGFGNYTCPQNYECVLDHNIVVKGRGHSIPGWRNLLGQDLGPIGLCGINPDNQSNSINQPDNA